MKPDFSGWATKAGLKCSDGRTIMPDAFKHQDKMTVPLVWMHGHKDPQNVLGHVNLENRPEGVWAEAFFNESPAAVHSREAVSHKDVRFMSIYANELVEKAKQVFHGMIREVSLVLSGANPGALIENVYLRHNGEDELLEGEAVIYTGLELEHSDADDEEEINHADGEGDDGETIEDIYDSLSDKQKQVVHFMLGEALQAGSSNSAEHSNSDDDQEGTNQMTTHNVFESKEGGATKEGVLSHDAMKSLMSDAMAEAIKNKTSFKSSLEGLAALQHGINDIESLFPEATQLTQAPEFFGRRTEWVQKVLGGARKSPFSRIKSATADLTQDEARAKGYIKGNLKKEEFFAVSSRTTTPQTIYKKQKLDRDDIIDITDFDVVAWMKGEMRLMLDEEIARAILIGDGREVDDDDKIQETNIRPIASDDPFYVTTIGVQLDDASSSMLETVDAIVRSRHVLRGSGSPTFFTTEYWLGRFLTLRDDNNIRMYRTLQDIATELRVSEIVPVEVLENEPDIIGIIVNMSDYNLGADKGGQVALFDDFDIDYNQYKYLIETRLSGALIRPKSAMVIREGAGSSNAPVTPTAPTFDAETGALTIVNTTGVVYTRTDTDAVVNAGGSPYSVDPGESITIVATAASGYILATTEDTSWTFTADA